MNFKGLAFSHEIKADKIINGPIFFVSFITILMKYLPQRNQFRFLFYLYMMGKKPEFGLAKWNSNLSEFQ